MGRTVRRTAGISWEQRHRQAVTQYLKMMVISGVVRRADLDPPLLHLSSAKIGIDPYGGDLDPDDEVEEPGWLARIFLSREYLLRRYH
ncbi:MAG: hypothetical protein A2V62_00905 [Nitrospirae bacterium RBG_19FT_COMBO_58_9]|nr:MAG: hypothetical protein A2V62_00905 [Nitrospirae bacterium RBG_19FT_COMBO_58_9]